MQFNEIIGRETEKEYLRELVQKNRLSHSMLFLGNEGSGALSLAIAFAQYILCERVHPKDNVAAGPTLFGEPEPVIENTVARPDSCGACAACLKAAQIIHPDLHFSYPTLKRDRNHDRILSTDYMNEWREFLKEQPFGNVTDWLNFLKTSSTAKIDSPENKQGNITVAECEDILHKLSLRPYESDFKILIMWMPEYLGKEGNRLLKLIEEPPEGTIFIFVAESEDEILPTILSRTQLIKIPYPTDEEVEKLLLDHGADPVQAAQVASVAAGNIREALSTFKKHDNNWLASIRTWMNIIYKNNVDSQLKWIDDVNQQGREKQKQLLNYFLYLIGISLKIRFMHPDDVKVLSKDEKDFAFTLNQLCEFEILEEMTEELNKAIYFIERNANSKLLFHALTIRFFHLIKEKQLILIH